MTKQEIKWLDKVMSRPQKYRIDVDNGAVFVTEIVKNECVFEFNEYGYHFLLDLLKHLGYNAEAV